MIALLPGWVGHSSPRAIECLVFRAWVEVDRSACSLRRCAERSGGTGPAVASAEYSLNARAAHVVGPDAPSHRHLAPRAGDPLMLPIDQEVALFVFVCAGL